MKLATIAPRLNMHDSPSSLGSSTHSFTLLIFRFSILSKKLRSPSKRILICSLKTIMFPAAIFLKSVTSAKWFKLLSLNRPSFVAHFGHSLTKYYRKNISEIPILYPYNILVKFWQPFGTALRASASISRK